MTSFVSNSVSTRVLNKCCRSSSAGSDWKNLFETCPRTVIMGGGCLGHTLVVRDIILNNNSQGEDSSCSRAAVCVVYFCTMSCSTMLSSSVKADMPSLHFCDRASSSGKRLCKISCIKNKTCVKVLKYRISSKDLKVRVTHYIFFNVTFVWYYFISMYIIVLNLESVDEILWYYHSY